MKDEKAQPDPDEQLRGEVPQTWYPILPGFPMEAPSERGIFSERSTRRASVSWSQAKDQYSASAYL